MHKCETCGNEVWSEEEVKAARRKDNRHGWIFFIVLILVGIIAGKVVGDPSKWTKEQQIQFACWATFQSCK